LARILLPGAIPGYSRIRDLDGIQAFLSLHQEDREPLITPEASVQQNGIRRTGEEFELSEYSRYYKHLNRDSETTY
jgi:hypothetical protein